MTLSMIIEFEGDNFGVFKSGSTVKGSLKLSSIGNNSISALYIEVEGRGACKWPSIDTTAHPNGYTNLAKYFTEVIFLIGNQDYSTLTSVIGLNNYTFSFKIPDNVPSSIEGKFGNIRYYCKAILVTPHNPDQETLNYFQVIARKDLNEDSLLRESQNVEVDEYFCYCCLFCSSSMIFTANVPKSGFAIGETVKISVNIHNKSDITIKGFKVILEAKIKFKSQLPKDKSQSTEKEIKTVYKENTASSRDKFDTIIYFQVPITASTSTETEMPEYSNIINISYQLKVIAKVVEWHFNPELVIPIVIGTEPIVEFYHPERSMLSPLPNSTRNEAVTAEVYEPTAPLMFSREDPPPSYEASASAIMRPIGFHTDSIMKN